MRADDLVDLSFKDRTILKHKNATLSLDGLVFEQSSVEELPPANLKRSGLY